MNKHQLRIQDMQDKSVLNLCLKYFSEVFTNGNRVLELCSLAAVLWSACATRTCVFQSQGSHCILCHSSFHDTVDANQDRKPAGITIYHFCVCVCVSSCSLEGNKSIKKKKKREKQTLKSKWINAFLVRRERACFLQSCIQGDSE